MKVFCNCGTEWEEHGDAHAFSPERAEYESDEHDRRRQTKLVITSGRNGDWYLSTCLESEAGIMSVRLSTSGGASSAAPGLCPGAAQMFRSIVLARTGIEL